MINAIRKVIAAYHDAPVGECRWCQHEDDGTIRTDGGIYGTPALAEAISDLELVVDLLDRTGMQVCYSDPR